MKDRVIIIGAGLAGIVAAFAAHRKGVEVLVLDRTGSGLGTNSAMANAMFNGP
nr:FAD-binding protein [Deltaproteobacteria bacterium]